MSTAHHGTNITFMVLRHPILVILGAVCDKNSFPLNTYNTICAKDLIFANCDVAKYSMTIKDEKLNKIRRPADQIKLAGQRRLSEECRIYFCPPEPS